MYTKKQIPVMLARRAAQLRDERFYEGSPCKAAGHTQRYTKSGKCVECSKTYQIIKYYLGKALPPP